MEASNMLATGAAASIYDETTKNLNSKIIAANITHVEQNKSNDYNKHIFATNSYARRDQNWEHCCCSCKDISVKLEEATHKHENEVCGESGCTNAQQQKRNHQHMRQKQDYQQQSYTQVSTTGKAKLSILHCCMSTTAAEVGCGNDDFIKKSDSAAITVPQRQLGRHRYKPNTSVHHGFGDCIPLTPINGGDVSATACYTTATGTTMSAASNIFPKMLPTIKATAPAEPTPSYNKQQQWQHQHTNSETSKFRDSSYNYSHNLLPIAGSSYFDSHIYANQIKSRCMTSSHHFNRSRSRNYFSIMCGSKLHSSSNRRIAKVNRIGLRSLIIILLSLSQIKWTHALLMVEPAFIGLSIGGGDIASRSTDDLNSKNVLNSNHSSSHNRQNIKSLSDSSNIGDITGSTGSTTAAVGVVGSAAAVPGGYLDKLDNLERSVAAVLIKVAYGTTSTTKRSIPDNSYVPSLTTIATPLLTTLRYLEKSSHQQQINIHHRNYELDLERDHALPTSAPNADILKSNSNPTYPNPNRHHNHDRERHRHIINSTPLPSLPNILKKSNGQSPTIPMYPGDIPSYSPPARSFFTPPLPPEYQNPFADKPTLRGTNNEGIVANTGTYINRRPIPPPSLMPGHERIPFRPPDLAASTGGNGNSQVGSVQSTGSADINPAMSSSVSTEAERKKALNTPSRNNGSGDGGGLTRGQPATSENKSYYDTSIQQDNTLLQSSSGAVSSHNSQQEVLPSIRRILSGSNGNKGEIPEVLLKQATSRPIISYHQPPSSPVVLFDSGISNSTVQQNSDSEDVVGSGSSNINKSKNTNDNEGLDSGEGKLQGKNKISAKSSEHTQNGVKGNGSSTPATAAAIDGGEEKVAVAAETSSTASTMSSTTVAKNETQIPGSGSSGGHDGGSDGSSSTTAAAASNNSTWAVAWNIHVYFSVVLFTILAVYSLYKVLTYNKLTHLFSQSYFVCIHLILIVICSARIFYLCYDAYNIHATFSIFVSEVLLNLPATFLTISFSVLILFLFLKALNHKNNRYSALIRPLTVVVGCGVHVVLCITLHYVESYTLQNQQQQHLFYQQQQQLLYRRQQQQLLQQHQMHHQQYVAAANLLTHTSSSSSSMYAALLLQQSSAATTASITASAPPPRVLSLICQIIYIFVCLFLGLLYLYLYRILKRILRSKSQNYIHGYQNLSYAIHITIATALLFVLLAALQIFGAISISTTRPLIQQLTAEIDWLQWGYQFSLRLIEIAIITLLSWVAGLKTSGGSPGGGIGGGGSSLGIGDARYGGAHGGGGNVVFGGGNSSVHNREKHTHHHHHNHSNVAGFFLPCTSSSSQEQFDTDYPAVCNANTNLHTYTMRTGKLIYDDSFALNSLSGGGSGQSSQLVSVSGVPSVRNAGEFQLQSQPTYQRPYDTGSLHSSAAASHTVADYGTQSTLTGGANRYHQETPQYADYLTDATTDHYENPNFDLHGSVSGSGSGMAVNNSMQKFAKTSTTSTTASSSGGSGSSAASQQQMLLLQSDSCYSEPLQPPAHASSYDINHFERTQLNGIGNSSGGGVSGPALMDWIEPLHAGQPLSRALDGHHSKREKKSSHTHTTLDRSVYENPERRSSNSSHSCVTSSGRYASYNSFDRSGPYNGVRKSGTLNNIAGGSSGSTGNGVVAGMGIIHGRNSSSSSAASSNVSTTMASSQRASGVQTLADRHHHQQQHNNQRGSRNSGNAVRNGIVSSGVREHDVAMFGRSSLEPDNNHKLQVHQQQQQNPDDDMMLSGSNVERTNLINNEDGSCIINSNTTFNIGGIGSQLANELNGAANTTTTERLLGKAPLKNSYDSSLHSSGNIYLQANYHPNQNAAIPSHTHNKQQRQLPSNSDSSGPTDLGVSASSTSKNSGTSSIVLDSVNVGTCGSNGEVLVSEHGFVRFRALDDMNNAQGVGIHNASVRNNQS